MHVKNPYRYYLFLAGLTGIAMQLCFIRELLMLFSGNEMLIGITYAFWMWFTAIGSITVKNIKPEPYQIRITFIFFIIIPLITLLLIRYLKPVIFTVGLEPSFWGTVLFTAISMAPFTIISGMLFTWFSTMINSDQKFVSDAYAIDSAGIMAGTVILPLFLTGFVFSIEAILYILVFNLIVISLLFSKKTIRIFLFFTLMMIFALMFSGHNLLVTFEKATLKNLYPHQDITAIYPSKYGELVITRYDSQKMMFENGTLMMCDKNIAGNEEIVHFALSQQRRHRKVLCISGDITGIAEQLQKYPATNTWFIQLNPGLIKAAGKHFNLLPQFTYIHVDPFIFLDTTKHHFDYVLMPVPLPSNFYLNRFYTLNFFRQIKHRMVPNGIFIVKLNLSADYLARKERHLAASVYHTLKSQFRNVVPVPASALYLMASDSVINLKIAETVDSLAIDNEFVNNNFMNYNDIAVKSDKLTHQISGSQKINTLENPSTVFLYQLHYFEFLKTRKYSVLILAGILMVVVLFILTRLQITEAAVTLTGFSSASLQIIVFLLFQSVFGFLYSALGFLTFAFMAGLTAGSYLANRLIKPSPHRFLSVHLLFVAIIILTALCIPAMFKFQLFNIISKTIFYTVSLFAGFITGLQFSWSLSENVTKARKSLPVVFSGDLLGAGIGSLATSVILIPVFGFGISLLLLSLLNLLFYIICQFIWKTRTSSH